MRKICGVSIFFISCIFGQFAIAQETKKITPPPLLEYNIGEVLRVRADKFASLYYYTKPSDKILLQISEKYQKAAQYGSKIALGKLGDFYKKRGDIQNATLWYEKSLESGYINNSYDLAKIYAASNRCREALDMLDKALALNIHYINETYVYWHNNNYCGANNYEKLFPLAKELAPKGNIFAIDALTNIYSNDKNNNYNLDLAWAWGKIASLRWNTEYDNMIFDKTVAKNRQNYIEEKLLKIRPIDGAHRELANICSTSTACNAIPESQFPKGIFANKSNNKIIAISPAPSPAPPSANCGVTCVDFESTIKLLPKSYNKSISLFKEAEEFEKQARANGNNNLDYSAIIEKYKLAASSFHAMAMYRISEIYIEQNNMLEAQIWLKKAADNGLAKAKLELARNYAKTSENCVKAPDYYLSASISKNLEIIRAANFELDEYYKGKYCAPVDQTKLHAQQMRFAQLGNSEYQYQVAKNFNSGIGTNKSIIEALAWARIGFYSRQTSIIFPSKDDKEMRSFFQTESVKLNADDREKLKEKINSLCMLKNICAYITDEKLIEMVEF